MRRLAALCAALVLGVVACGSDDGQGHDTETSFGFGAPADAGDADRTVQVEALDSLEFDPARLKVRRGQAITFVVTNKGDDDHEFVLGDRSYQDDHAQQMEDGGHFHGSGNAVTVPPGETAEITWLFESSGEVLFACHVAGHYEGGMVGSIAVR